jgi:hypothetical protein
MSYLLRSKDEAIASSQVLIDPTHFTISHGGVIKSTAEGLFVYEYESSAHRAYFYVTGHFL